VGRSISFATLALLLGTTGLHADEADAVKALEKISGAVVVRAQNKPEGPVTQVFLNVTKATDADLKHLREFKQLNTLGLAASKITDAGLKDLKECKGIKFLGLSQTAITDAGLKDLKELKDLISVELDQTKVTDAGLKELHGLTNLSRVSLRQTKVTDEGIQELQKALPKCKVER
jgi:hypothetical protein